MIPHVMQAPIGPSSTPELVNAVGAAGGLGCLGASWTPLPRLREQLRLLRAEYCVNLVLDFDQRERLALVLAEGAPFVSFSWGIDAELIGRALDAGTRVLVQAGDAATAERAVEAGADAVIVQGVEAGGHVEATEPLHALLEQVRGLPVPVIAAGGITTAEAADAARDAGAQAIAAGTAFLAAEEADVHPVYRRRVLEASSEDTVLTGVFEIGWPDAPHRVLRNATVEAGLPYSDVQPTSRVEGDVEAMALYAGTGVGAVREVEPAAAIVARLSPAA